MDSTLNRFEEAQIDYYKSALQELHSGRKRSHWMWFIFPQLKGLSKSSDSWFYGLSNITEATAYLNHPVLGPRLIECTQAVLEHQSKSAHSIFGSPDDLKFSSCMTLFSLVPDAPSEFRIAIEKFFNGKFDKKTIELLKERRNGHV